MSAPVRFLTVILVGWGAVRAATLGTLPGFTVSYAKPVSPPPVVATEFPQLAASSFAADGSWNSSAEPLQAPMPVARASQAPIPYYVPRYYPVYAAQTGYSPAPMTPRATWSLVSAGSGFTLGLAEPPAYSQLPPFIPAALPTAQSTAAPQPVLGPDGKPKLDRWQMSSWALLRGAPTPGALASGGTLGGSQAGARVTYAINRSLALSLRTTSPIGGSSGAEVAGGIRWAPLKSLPLAITAERRQSISRFGGGRSDFALFVEGGLYRHPMPWRFELDAYAQAGVVGITERDLFADAALIFTRPVYNRFSAGLGVWGGYQPGVYRLDAGPRITMRVRDNIRAHADYRQRLVGSAQPASGPTLTLAADF